MYNGRVVHVIWTLRLIFFFTFWTVSAFMVIVFEMYEKYKKKHLLLNLNATKKY